MTLISVIIPCYNAEDFIVRAVESVKNQEIEDIEILIVDDCSTDGSRAVIGTLAESDKRIVPVFLEKNSGPAAARNQAWKIAKGEWVTLLDADDLYLANRLQRMLEVASELNADVVADNLSIRHFGEDLHLSYAFPNIPLGHTAVVDRDFFFNNLWNGPGKYGMGILKPMFRREFILDNAITYDERYRIGEDMLFYMNCVLQGAKMVLIGNPYYIYHKRPGSISNIGTSVFRTLADMCSEIIANDGRLSHLDIKLLETRRDGLLRYMHWRELRHLKKARSWKLFSLYALKHPTALMDMASSSLKWRTSANQKMS